MVRLDDIELLPLMDTLKVQKIDDEVYFSKKYNGYISNSRLSLINPNQVLEKDKNGNPIAYGNPKAFFEGFGNHGIYTDSIVRGSAVHELTLQSDLFHMCYEVDRPTSKAGAMADELYKVMIDESLTTEERLEAMDKASDKIGYYKGKFDLDKKKALIAKCSDYWNARQRYESKELESAPIYLDPKSREVVERCVEALQNNGSIQELLHPEGLLETPISENEQAILLDVQVKMPNIEPFILRLKAKLDNYTIDVERNEICVNDVKTIGKIVSEFNTNFEIFHYHRELAIYNWLLTLVAKKYYGMDECIVKSNCLVVSTIPNYYTKVYEVTNLDLKKGFNEFKKLLKLVAYYKSKGWDFE